MCLNYCYHIYQNLLNFTNAFKCFHQKCKLASVKLGHPVNCKTCHNVSGTNQWISCVLLECDAYFMNQWADWVTYEFLFHYISDYPSQDDEKHLIVHCDSKKVAVLILSFPKWFHALIHITQQYTGWRIIFDGNIWMHS